METYMMMLYVSLEQEQALKQFFLDNGWEYCKPDLSSLTDNVGPLVAQIPHTKKPHSVPIKEAPPAQKSPVKTIPSQSSNITRTTSQEASAPAEPQPLPSTSGANVAKKRKLETDGADVGMTEKSTGAVSCTENLDGTETMDEGLSTEVPDASTVMESSNEENRSNDGDGADWEMFDKAKSSKQRNAADKRVVVKEESDEEQLIDPNLSKTPMVIKKETFSCEFCEMTFTIQRHLKNHCKKIHDVDIETSNWMSEKGDEKVYECDQCNCSYSRVTTLKKHQRTKHGASFVSEDKLFTCTVCFKKYDTAHHLELHEADKHGKVLNAGQVEHECRVCGKTFATYPELRQHRKEHGEEVTQHVCEVCGRSFTRRDTLLNHRKTVHLGIKRKRYPPPTERTFQCELCGSSFLRRSNLNEHFQNKHCDEPFNHRCEHCDATFKRPSILEYHVNKVHLKQKPYTCDKCQKKAYSKHALHEHKQLCSMQPDKKIKCDQCGKLFTTPHNHKLHMQAVHSTPALACPCGTVVKWASSVAKHKRRCSLFNAKHRKNKQLSVQLMERILDVEEQQTTEDPTVVFLQNQLDESGGEVYTEMEGGEEMQTTVVVSEAEAEVAEGVTKLLEGITPGGALVEGQDGEGGSVTVVEEQVVGEGGQAATTTYNNVRVVTSGGEEGTDSEQKIYYVIQY